MSDTPDNDIETLKFQFDQDQQRADLELRKQQLELDQRRHEAEVELKQKELELRRAHETKLWRNPLVLAIAAGIIGLVSNAVVAAVNGSMDRDLEHQKTESKMILEALKTGDPDKAAENLQLLVDTGLVQRHGDRLQNYLKRRSQGGGAVLPVAATAQAHKVEELEEAEED
ncbi:MAG: hypothetical protein KC492_06990 [Myxococcales bacterium]|nr:hypothetical protein [Myxococcales bacterium]MCB9608279.1 hypothetical protein [Polyangiaceae bacterium]